MASFARTDSIASNEGFSQIAFGKCMAVQAVCLSRISCPLTFPTHYVLDQRDNFKVIWVNTFPISTEMVNNHAIFYGPSCQLM